MSLPPSCFARATQASVPASQNTAPVIKFRCLYTHDIRRKAKRWQDGYLKFHTFNKRAMVYDDAGNFIGDHHWRESHDIQDGDELELDKGVLIQVSECMETTQTDISVLFDKRKASQESPKQQKTPAPLSSGVSPYMRQPAALTRPLKSLNDVLGIQRGPIGRSVTPQSPYEQCHRTLGRVEYRQQEEERPAKRQKPAPSKEVLQRKSTNEPLRSRPDIVELDRSDFVKPLPKTVSIPSTQTVAKETTNSPQLAPNSRRDISSVQLGPSASKAVASTHSQLRTSSALSEKSTSRINGGEVPIRINPLRMRNEKPRPKLMYRALLPSKSSDKNSPVEEQTKSNKVAEGESCRDPDIDFSLSSSTLAVLDELNPDIPIGATKDSVACERIDRIPKMSRSQNTQTGFLNRIPTHAALYGSLASPAGVGIGDELGNEFGPLPSSSPDMQEDIQDNLPTANRIASVMRSNSDISHMVSGHSPLEAAPRKSLAGPPMADSVSTAVIRNERKLFRKSHSDSNALKNIDSGPSNLSHPLATKGPPRGERNNNRTKNVENGPWTAEAFDFFDWWPPGRPKPT